MIGEFQTIEIPWLVWGWWCEGTSTNLIFFTWFWHLWWGGHHQICIFSDICACWLSGFCILVFWVYGWGSRHEQLQHFHVTFAFWAWDFAVFGAQGSGMGCPETNKSTISSDFWGLGLEFGDSEKVLFIILGSMLFCRQRDPRLRNHFSCQKPNFPSVKWNILILDAGCLFWSSASFDPILHIHLVIPNVDPFCWMWWVGWVGGVV